MNQAYRFKCLTASVLIAAAVFFRVYLLTVCFDNSTGFYTQTAAPMLFRLYMLAVSLWLVWSVEREHTDALPNPLFSRATGGLTLLCGAAVLLFSILSAVSVRKVTALVWSAGIVPGLATACILFRAASAHLMGKAPALGSMAAVPALWGVSQLLIYFMAYPQIAGFSQRVLELAVWIILSLFLLAWGRLLAPEGSENDRKQVCILGRLFCLWGLTAMVGLLYPQADISSKVLALLIFVFALLCGQMSIILRKEM